MFPNQKKTKKNQSEKKRNTHQPCNFKVQVEKERERPNQKKPPKNNLPIYHPKEPDRESTRIRRSKEIRMNLVQRKETKHEVKKNAL